MCQAALSHQPSPADKLKREQISSSFLSTLLLSVTSYGDTSMTPVGIFMHKKIKAEYEVHTIRLIMILENTGTW
jgi:hypothetical protein